MNKKNNNYYKDIIKKYSPGVLSYIDDFTINKNTVEATVKGLQLKRIINNELQVIKNDFSELDENEKYICNNLKNLNKIDLLEFEKVIVQDCKNYKLLKSKDTELNKIKRKRMITIAIMIVCVIINGIISNINVSILSVLLIIITIIEIISLFAMVYYTIAYISNNVIYPYIRSKKAESIRKNLIKYDQKIKSIK